MSQRVISITMCCTRQPVSGHQRVIMNALSRTTVIPRLHPCYGWRFRVVPCIPTCRQDNPSFVFSLAGAAPDVAFAGGS
jgi:hypothetical protein